MPDKQQIVNSIEKIARKLGRAPSQKEFNSLSEISTCHVLQHFRSWNEAVRASRFRPYTLNIKPKDHALLEDWGRAVRRHRGVPPRRVYSREGKYNPRTLTKSVSGRGQDCRKRFAISPGANANGSTSWPFFPVPYRLVAHQEESARIPRTAPLSPHRLGKSGMLIEKAGQPMAIPLDSRGCPTNPSTNKVSSSCLVFWRKNSATWSKACKPASPIAKPCA
jgi:hypothetical protein